MADQDPTEFVNIRLSSHGADVAPGRVTRQSFDQVWKGKGWVLVSDEDAAAATDPDVGDVKSTAKQKG